MECECQDFKGINSLATDAYSEPCQPPKMEHFLQDAPSWMFGRFTPKVQIISDSKDITTLHLENFFPEQKSNHCSIDGKVSISTNAIK